MSVTFGRFELDESRRQLLKSGSDVHVTPKAFDLLALLIAEAPRVVRKETLHQRLWRTRSCLTPRWSASSRNFGAHSTIGIQHNR